MATITPQKRPGDPDLAEDISSASGEEIENTHYWHRPMNDEERREYIKQVNASEGFDVGDFVGRSLDQIIPCYLPEDQHKSSEYYNELRQELSGFCNQALETYDKEENANYEFVELVKANTLVVTGRMFYLTFRARSPFEQTSVTFQAIVWRKICKQGSEVKLCRKKPTQ